MRMSMIESFLKYFDDVDNILLEYSLPHKIESKWHGKIFFHVDMDEIKMDEKYWMKFIIKNLVRQNFSNELFLVNNYP
jgi:hypothetical protein